MFIDLGDKNLVIIIYRFFEQSVVLTKIAQFFAIWAIFILMAGLIVLLIRKRWFLFFASIAGLAILWLISQGMNWIINRPRPFITLDQYIPEPLIGDYPTDSSLPSDHSLAAFALATFLANFFQNQKISLIVYSLAGLIAFSRVAVAVHYPSDVIVGGLIGYFGALGWLKIIKNKTRVV